VTFNPRSIQFRLTAWYALILSAALCVLSVLIWFLMQQKMLSDIHRDLGEKADHFRAYVHHESSEIPRVNLMAEIEEFCHALPSSTYLTFAPVKGGSLFHYPATTGGRALAKAGMLNSMTQ